MSQPAKRHTGSTVVRLYEKAALRVDSWINTVTGLGTAARDKVFGAFFQRSVRLVDQELEDLYNGDDLAAKIVGKVVEDSLRGGYEITIGLDEGTGDTVSDASSDAGDVETVLEDELHASERVREAWTWGRLFGGAVLYIVTDEGFDADQAEPLDEERLRAVLALTVLDKRDLSPATIYDDPAHPKFGEVETYRVNSVGPVGVLTAQIVNVTIHETRLLVFHGALTTNRERQTNEGWPLSVLQRPYDVLRTFNVSFQALANILQDASQGIFEMDGLIDMIASGEKDAVQTRMALVDLQRSVARSLVIDAEKEDFRRLVPALTGYPEAIQLMMARLAAAADMPVTVLFGISPAGLNATGESDRLLWAQTVESHQTLVADPALTRLAELVMLSSDGPTGGRLPESWDLEFPALIHQTDTERANVRKTIAETDALYIREGVAFPEEIAVARFPATGYSPETVIDVELREEILEEEKEKALNPPPPPPSSRRRRSPVNFRLPQMRAAKMNRARRASSTRRSARPRTRSSRRSTASSGSSAAPSASSGATRRSATPILLPGGRLSGPASSDGEHSHAIGGGRSATLSTAASIQPCA